MLNISIIIPVKNGIATIRQCLDAIFAQTLIDQTEVIVIDSGSTDGTLEVLKQYPVRLFQIPPEAFNHGTTRNYGVSLAKGDFVVMTVQDAVATDNKWLEKMLRHFEDTKVAGVCGRQMIPQKKEINAFDWSRPVSEPKIEVYGYTDILEFNKLTPEDKRKICGWDNVNSMYRKTVLQKIPFEHIKFGEDITWAIKTINNGLTLIYDPNAKVEHYHPFNRKQEIDRKYIEMMQDYLLFDLRPRHINIFKKCVRLLYLSIRWNINPIAIIPQISKFMAYNAALNRFSNDIKYFSKPQLNSNLF